MQCKKRELAEENDPKFQHGASGNQERTKEDLKRGSRGAEEAREERIRALFKGWYVPGELYLPFRPSDSLWPHRL